MISQYCSKICVDKLFVEKEAVLDDHKAKRVKCLFYPLLKYLYYTWLYNSIFFQMYNVHWEYSPIPLAPPFPPPSFPCSPRQFHFYFHVFYTVWFYVSIKSPINTLKTVYMCLSTKDLFNLIWWSLYHFPVA